MSCVAPVDIEGVLAALAQSSDAQLLAGGTDFMVEVNHGGRAVGDVVSLHRVEELRAWRLEADTAVIGAAVTYAELEQGPLAEAVPALAQAARTVGSPQIRTAGTIGGNLATASPAGDTLPPLVALGASVELAGPGGRRTLAVQDFITGPKRTALGAGELIVAVHVPRRRGPQEYLKVGTRNAMVISVAGLALVVDVDARRVGCALGSVGPVIIRATEAEAWAEARVDWADGGLADPADLERFGELVGAAARPIDDHRSTAAYRRRAVEVCAVRAMRRCGR